MYKRKTRYSPRLRASLKILRVARHNGVACVDAIIMQRHERLKSLLRGHNKKVAAAGMKENPRHPNNTL